MLQEFLRLAIYVPIDEASEGPGLTVAFAAAVQEIMRVLREFAFTPTADSAPAHGVADIAAIVPSARVVTYIPARTPGGDVDRMIDALVSAHPWEHPLVEVDRVSLWMP